MTREYPLKDIKKWYFELLNAVNLFEQEFMKKPQIVGYSDNIYNQINLIVNQEKEHVVDSQGINPGEDEFIELGSVIIDESDIGIMLCDEFPDDRFALMSEPPDGDDGEPYFDLDEEQHYQWKKLA